MSTDDAWLLDMLVYARLARERVAGISRDEFVANIDKHLAATHLLLIVGEAAAQVSISTRSSLPKVPWNQIVRTRNIIVHHYFKVDLDTLWSILERDLPDLIAELEQVVPREQDT